MKILDGNNGIYFRTGVKTEGFPSFGGDTEASNRWGEWKKTILSDEVENSVTENRSKLITSGGVYTAIGDIETSLEDIRAKYGLGGEE
jgi:hypothetical protein